MFLDKETLKQMTQYQHPKKMCRFLSERGYKFDIDRYGYPLVLIAAVEQRLGATPETKNKKTVEPDFKALDNFKKGKKHGS